MTDNILQRLVSQVIKTPKFDIRQMNKACCIYVIQLYVEPTVNTEVHESLYQFHRSIFL